MFLYILILVLGKLSCYVNFNIVKFCGFMIKFFFFLYLNEIYVCDIL